MKVYKNHSWAKNPVIIHAAEAVVDDGWWSFVVEGIGLLLCPQACTLRARHLFPIKLVTIAAFQDVSLYVLLEQQTISLKNL